MNIEIFNFLHNLSGRSEILDKVIVFIAEPFGYILIVIAYLFLLLHSENESSELKNILKKFREIIILSFSVFSAYIFSIIIKNIVNNPRPFLILNDVNELFIYGGYDSFPSGHATFFAALAAAIFVYHRKVGFLFGLFAVIIGFSRVIAGIHFPIDILVGFMLGGSLSTLIYYGVNKFIKKYFPNTNFIIKN
jgi:undecaprenyl-diphosphatase